MREKTEGDAASASITVTFVITIFNKSQFIAPMIRSLRENLDVGSCEFIFIDDGSTDDSAQIVADAIRDLPNARIIGQPNRGPAIATNIAIANAKGTYIKLLDADDRLVSGIVTLMIHEMERSGADLLTGRIVEYAIEQDLPHAPATLQAVSELSDPLWTVIATGISNTSGSILRRRTAVQAGGCDESVFIQDFSLFLNIARHGRILVSDAVIAYVPNEAAGRVSAMRGQALHDMNRALYNLVTKDRSLSGAYLRLAMRRAAGRTWKWARRHRGATLISKEFLTHALSRLPIASLAPWILRNACRPFRTQSHLRFPGPAI